MSNALASEQDLTRLMTLWQTALDSADAAQWQARLPSMLHELLAHAPVGLALLDHNLRYLYVNETLAALNGASVEAHLGRTVGEIVPSPALAVNPQRQVLETGEPLYDLEMDSPGLSTTDDPSRWLASFYPLRCHSGPVLGVQVVVTERAGKAESLAGEREAPVASEERLANILESITDAFVVLDSEKRVTIVNGVAERLWRMPRQRILGAKMCDLFPDGEGLKFGPEFSRAMREGTPVQFEEYYAPFDIWYDVRAFPSPDGLTVYFRDITRRKRAAEELRTIASRARCLLWHADMEESGQEQLYWTLKIADEEAAQRFLPLEVPPGRTYEEVWHENRIMDDRGRSDAFGTQEIRAGRSYSQEFRCRRNDGEIRWLAEDVQIETVAPGRWRAVGVCMDITDRKQAQEKAARLQAALDEEHHLVASLQQCFLPQDAPAIPEFHCAGNYRSAHLRERVGGDFYDLVLPDADHLAFCIGDVSGKGVRAAQITMMVKNMWRAFLLECPEPGELLERLSQTLSHYLDLEDFVTMVCGTIERSTGRLRYAIAGHPPPLVRRTSGQCEFLTGGGTILCGLLENRYETYETMLSGGDLLLLCTDGITELRRERRMLDLEGLQEWILACPVSRPEQVIMHLFERAQEWSGGALHDDIALVAIHCQLGEELLEGE